MDISLGHARPLMLFWELVVLHPTLGTSGSSRNGTYLQGVRRRPLRCEDRESSRLLHRCKQALFLLKPSSLLSCGVRLKHHSPKSPTSMPKNVMAPVHPGTVLREEYLQPLGMSANALAKALHVPASRIHDILL